MTNTTKTKKTKHISRELERELIRDYQENGNNYALQELLEAHNPYVQQLASKAFTQFNKVVEFEDLVQQARLGFIRAAQEFDLTRLVDNEDSPNFGQTLRFLTYAHTKINAQMQEAWHHAHPVHIPAHILRAIHFKKIDEKSPQTAKSLENKRIAKIGMKGESLDALTEDFRNKEGRSSNNFEIQYNENGVKIADPTFEDSIKEIFSPMVSSALKKLTSKEIKIFNMRTGLEDGKKYSIEDISERLQLDVTDVDKTFKKAKRVLVKNLRDPFNQNKAVPRKELL